MRHLVTPTTYAMAQQQDRVTLLPTLCGRRTPTGMLTLHLGPDVCETCTAIRERELLIASLRRTVARSQERGLRAMEAGDLITAAKMARVHREASTRLATYGVALAA